MKPAFDTEQFLSCDHHDYLDEGEKHQVQAIKSAALSVFAKMPDARAIAALPMNNLSGDPVKLSEMLPRDRNVEPTNIGNMSVDDGQRGYDLFSRLLRDRIIMIDTDINEYSASIVCAALLFLETDASKNDNGGPDDKIKIHITGPGGSVYHGLAIYDTMQSIRSPNETIGLGYQASMCSLLMVAGDQGHRRMGKNARNMVHEVSGGAQGRNFVMKSSVAESDRLNTILKNIYAKHTGLTPEFWNYVMSPNDVWFSADQCVKIGIVDKVIPLLRPEPMHSYFTEMAVKKAVVPNNMKGIIKMLQPSNGAGIDIYAELVTELSTYEKFWYPTRSAQEAWRQLKTDNPEVAAKIKSELDQMNERTIAKGKAHTLVLEGIQPRAGVTAELLMQDIAVKAHKQLNHSVKKAEMLGHAAKGIAHLLNIHKNPAILTQSNDNPKLDGKGNDNAPKA